MFGGFGHLHMVIAERDLRQMRTAMTCCSLAMLCMRLAISSAPSRSHRCQFRRAQLWGGWLHLSRLLERQHQAALLASRPLYAKAPVSGLAEKDDDFFNPVLVGFSEEASIKSNDASGMLRRLSVVSMAPDNS